MERLIDKLKCGRNRANVTHFHTSFRITMMLVIMVIIIIIIIIMVNDGIALKLIRLNK